MGVGGHEEDIRVRDAGVTWPDRFEGFTILSLGICRRYLTNDLERRRRFGRNVTREVRESFDAPVCELIVLDHLSKLLASKGE